MTDYNCTDRGAGCPFSDNGGNGQGTFDQCLTGMSLAMVYSPCQEFTGLYAADEALERGTIFMELEKPFYGARRTK